ncbi:MAG: cbb3-type cytochrome oxidase assembly protein CcoS [Coleofasciculaceae cyanobacterium SM2_3_26]|nr:cbb3-type cytochrome oxidase assembly protein CcoS [Coleofasciculaceae cyanobacterium SM2_3_26]
MSATFLLVFLAIALCAFGCSESGQTQTEPIQGGQEVLEVDDSPSAAPKQFDGTRPERPSNSEQ